MRTLLILISFLPFAANAAFVGALKTETGIWQTKIDGNATGFAAGPSVAYAYEQYFGSLGFMIGNYSGDNGSNFGRNELDLSLGYRVMPALSGFLAFKQSYIDYSSNSTELNFDDRITSVGLGAALNYPLTRELILLSTVTMFPSWDSYESSERSVSGNGFGTGMELGASYRVARTTALSARAKVQASAINYDTTETSWNSRMWKLGLELVHAF